MCPNGTQGGMSPAALRESLRSQGGSSAPQPAASSGGPMPAASPAPNPGVPEPQPPTPAERLNAVRMGTNDNMAELLVQQTMEFIENCDVSVNDSYAIVDEVCRGLDPRMHYAFESHLILLLIKIKNSMPEVLHRTLHEVGAKLPSLTYEQQCGILFSILRESVTASKE